MIFLKYTYWIFNPTKILISIGYSSGRWGPSTHFQETPQVKKRYPRGIPTDVACKNSGPKTWGSPRDRDSEVKRHPKSLILISIYTISIVMLLHVQTEANPA
jgi:hypothetical protein